MISYLIEFAILHLLFFGIYKTLLQKETQLSFLRFFLLGSTVLSLIIPAISIPTSNPILPSLSTSAIWLPEVTTLKKMEEGFFTFEWYHYLLIAISAAFVFKLFIGLIRISKLYKNSEKQEVNGIAVRVLSGLKNSFSFFQWIFIDTKHFTNAEDIVHHELGHAKKYHSLDILFFNALTIFFWWTPSIWLMIKEIKNIHEFEADEFALNTSDQTYVKTLVHCTLQAHGMNLASSFDDAPIFNRLNFMKKMKKKISVWKMASIASLVAISGIMFACEEEINDGIEEIIEESSQQVEYSVDVQAALDRLQAEKPNEKFAVIETTFDNEENINKLNEYDPNQVEQIFITKEDDRKSIVMIVNQSSELFEKTMVIQEQMQEDNSQAVFTIVEEPASFPGGMDALGKFLRENMKYPEQARKDGVSGHVYVEFIIEKDGSISDAKVAKGIGAGCDAEAIRIIENSPKWQPGTQNGEIVRQKMMLPIVFAVK